MDFWERLDEAILAHGSTRKAIAAKVDFTVGNFASWKNRRNYPTADVAVAIARALNVTVEWLVEGEDRSGLPPALVADLRLLAEHAPERFGLLERTASTEASEIRRRASAEAANGGISG